MSGRIMVYGATGYTGKLIATMANEKGIEPVLAGRNSKKLKAIAEPLGFEWRAFSLADPETIDANLKDMAVVLHVAGPFSATSRPMVDACLRVGIHYLDITGEIDVFEALAKRDAEAKQRGIVLLPGVGFDVVPSDCLIAHTAKRLHEPIVVRLGISAPALLSRGTAKTSVESITRPSRYRRDGQIVSAPAGSLTRDIDFGDGARSSFAASWGDVATAFYSTEIPNIEVYFEANPFFNKFNSMSRNLGWLLGTRPFQVWLKAAINFQPDGPTDAQRAASQVVLVAEVEDAGGNKASSRLHTPEAYTLTASTSLGIASRILENEIAPGFQTPSNAFGADFILGFEGVKREDIGSAHNN